ncbi:dihydrolipoamide acetyltransferase family protein [Cupriavidus pinatubonensis]|uniref:Dihydrolipoamide acetyltransferase component of pyruvate dehydrogenase complex n=1 Tax=Cupriavidus pinatubonensis TaxID=248026 RepID=A0ABM8XYQ2_9BURK|nr:dihydrolipoamide acetyltransferase family protein [Cupriavidus pinatubonensis]CAG9185601.1 Dihydrolipoyllysine-residue acetyltransferase component of pyruvate dehydrogenase complex [Cupriavidus pinatubonensis]
MIEFRLPSLGADMDEGTLLQWAVKPGDVVRKGQIMAVVDTSKAAIEVETWHDGIVGELLASPGDKMPVGTLMATLLEPGESLGTVRCAPSKPARPAAAPGRHGGRKVSPAARKFAREQGIDADKLVGSGPGGAVTLSDVEQAVRKAGGAAGERQADIRRAIGAAMARAKREIPHYYVCETIPLRVATDWLVKANADRPITERVLPAALLIKAVAVALKRFPELNGYYRNDAFEAASAINIGVAISLRQGGLAAPALLDASGKPLAQLMQELADLVRRCRSGSLRRAELSEPTVTVTNLGDQGVEQVFGVIYPPQVALVGFGRIHERPWVDNGALTVVPAVTASLSADHRVSDGHCGARFLADVRELLQHPEEIEP